MSAKYLMGLDIGGSGGRCLLVHSETGATSVTFRGWSHIPAPHAGSWAFDLDLAAIWRVLGAIAQEALRRARIGPQDVAGLAVTGMRFGLVVLDRQEDALLATPNKDARAFEQGMRLAQEDGPALYRRTGHYPGPIFAASRLLWLKEKNLAALRSAHAVLSVSDWAGYRLSGQLAAEASQAAESLLFDLHTHGWAFNLIRAWGLPEGVFPPIREAGAPLGRLTEAAAAHLGLAVGTPVAMGGADTQGALLGMGVIAERQIGIIAGTTAPIQIVSAQPQLDDQMRIWTGLHIIPGLYVLESNAGAMGSALEWMAGLMYTQGSSPVAMLAAEAGSSSPGAHGILSTIGASVFNAAEMGPPIDHLTFSSVNTLNGAQGRADVARAILEGMAYAVRANIEQLLSIVGAPLQEAWLTGGISRSATWTRLLSNVLACPVHVSALPEASALGAAICAGVGAGLYPDLIAGAKALARVGREHLPDSDTSRIYQGLYGDWQALRQERARADALASGLIVQSMTAPRITADAPILVPFRPRIYVTAEMDEATLGQLRELGDVTYACYREQSRVLVGDDLVEALAGYHVFVTEVDIVSADDLRRLPDLRLIVACRGNAVNVDIAACTAAGVPVIHTPARNADAVADLTVGLMVMLARKLPDAMSFLRQPGGEVGDMARMGMAHEQFQGHELWRKTVGVVGGGAVGRRVIARLLPFGARILLYDPYLSAEQIALLGAEQATFAQLLEESDFITLHVPVTDETREMINAEALAHIKLGAFLINTARAALVNQEALMAALRSGRLGGAALDVFPVEPPASDDPLLAMPNVIATPHIAGNTHEVAAHQGEIVVRELKRLLSDQTPEHILNADALSAFAWTGARRASEERLRELAAAPGPGVTDLDVAAQKAHATAKKAVPPPQPDTKKGGLLATLKKVLVGEAKTAPTPAPAPTAPMGDTSATRVRMVRLLEEFLGCVAADAGLAAFAQDKNVVMHFTLRDLDQVFYLSFVQGQVGAALGEPPREPDVRLKMSADTFDGIFTGRVNPMRAAMTGKLAFSGDTGKAMVFQRLQKDVSRLYAEARDKVGDPGDLTQLAGPAQPPIAPPSATPSVGAAIARPGDVCDAILQVANELYARGLITATGGNVSTRCDDNPTEIWITPSAIFKGDLRPEMLVRIGLDGNPVAESEYSASSERRLHCAIYRARPDVTAVIHSHAPQATLMALTGTSFLPISAEAAFLGEIPVVPFMMPGSDALGDAVAKALGTGAAVLMQNHGLVVAASSLRRAADITEVIEVTAREILGCKALGVTPPLLPEDVVRQLREIGGTIG